MTAHTTLHEMLKKPITIETAAAIEALASQHFRMSCITPTELYTYSYALAAAVMEIKNDNTTQTCRDFTSHC
jgi:hypothetical protein